jgi:hypothetical protein
MSLLSVIQDFCKLHALAVPTAIIGSTDTQTIQLQAILDELVRELVTESKFQVTTLEAVFSTVPGEDQGLITDLAPNGYQRAIFETFYDRTLRRPLSGPVSETEWQQLKALPSTGTYYKFRLRGNHLLLYPAPFTSSSDIAFEYMSDWAYKDATTGAAKDSVTVDTDAFVFPENILKKGLAYRFKQIKGLPYQADEKAYWDMVNNYIATNKVSRRINVSEGAPVDIKPGIFVPSNTWSVT